MREEPEQPRSRASPSRGSGMGVHRRRPAASTVVWLETAFKDLRYGVRQLRKTPVFVAVAVLSLALGIGANTAIFTLFNAVLRQYLPVRDPARLVLFYDGIAAGVYSGDGYSIPSDEFSYPFYQYLKSHKEPFAGLCAFRQSNDSAVLHVAGENEAGPWERATVHLVSGNYFGVLGVGAAIGRVLEPADDTPGSQGSAVLSYRFWRDRFHSDQGILGQTVILNGTAFKIAGVADPEFFGERIQAAPDFWLPLSFQPEILHSSSYLAARGVYWLNFMGRLKPGVGMANARSAVNLRIRQFYLEQAGADLSAGTRRKIESVNVVLRPGGGGISALRFLYSRPLHLLMATVGVVLLIACANVATLLLARASMRRAEFQARLALGASRARLLRQVLTENVLLSFIGGAAGVVVAWWIVKALVVSLHVSPVVRIRPDAAVLVFTFTLCIATGILCGLFPALKFSRMHPRPGTGCQPVVFGRWRIGSGQILIAVQIALSLTLLVGGSLLVQSFLELEHQKLGFHRDNILVIRSDASLAGYRQTQLAELYRNLGGRLSHLPGVVSASVAGHTPESGNSSSSNFSIEGYNATANLKMDVYHLPVAPGFFETLGIPLVRGRTLSVRDASATDPVAVVNQCFVDTYLPNRDPIGRRISLGAPFRAPGAEIIGVVGNSSFYDLHKMPPPMMFFSILQQPTPEFHVVLRTAAPPLSLVPEVRIAFNLLDGRLPVLRTTTLDNQIENTLSQQKLITMLCSAFGLLALALALVGIYGTTAYSVAERTNEIGIRMAVGAQRRSVMRLILGDAALVVTTGVIFGAPLSFIASHLLKSFLFGVGVLNLLSFGSAVLLIIGLAMLACVPPARRAAKIDPMRALRHE